MSYLFDHTWEKERQRLAAMEAALDPWTIRNLISIGIEPGWRCLEIGAGGGSIAAWLCQQVGAAGRVVATDLETRFLEAIEADNLEVRRHDIVTDALETNSYDLIHARAVLDHLPERDAVVNRLAAALRPGGWLAIEAGDFSTLRATMERGDDARFFDSACAAILAVSAATGVDHFYGRRLGTVFRRAGLAGVSVAGLVCEWDRAHPLAELFHLTFQRIRDRVVEAGALTVEQFERLFALMESPAFRALGNIVYFACGRRAG
jgi:SAM-dependent methyltransferase